MKVSVIIPVYNVSKYIEKSINCICNQTMQEGVECIIVNDCTPDDSILKAKQIIDAYNGSILFKIIDHNENRGLAAARSTGMKYATGEYVLHLDSDDFYEYNMLEELYKNAVENDADVVICDFYHTYTDNELQQKVYLLNTNIEYIECIISSNYKRFKWNIWNKMIKKSLFEDNKIDWIEGINYSEDLLICLKIFFFAKNIEKVDLYLYHYTHYNENSYMNNNNSKSLENEILVIKEMETFLKQTKTIDLFNRLLIDRKLSAKNSMIKLGENSSIPYYCKLFPETNKFIFSSKRITKTSKVRLFLGITNRRLLYIFKILESFLRK